MGYSQFATKRLSVPNWVSNNVTYPNMVLLLTVHGEARVISSQLSSTRLAGPDDGA